MAGWRFVGLPLALLALPMAARAQSGIAEVWANSGSLPGFDVTQAGTARIDIEFGSDRRVTACRVVRSSAPAFESPSCALVRARGWTATNERAQRQGRETVLVRWSLSVEQADGSSDGTVIISPLAVVAGIVNVITPTGRPSRAVVNLVIGVDGRIKECVIATASTLPDNDRIFCLMQRARGLYLPALDEAGNPRIANVQTSVTWR